jgi:hypothetical protein
MVKKIRKLTPKQFADLEKRMDNFEYYKTYGMYGMARRTAGGIVTLTKGTTKEASVKRWYDIAMKELRIRERHVTEK